MKNYLFILAVVALTACNAAELEKQLALEMSEDGYGPNYEALVEIESEESYNVAEERLIASKAMPGFGWSPDAAIVGRFPVYIPGIDEPSYYEYKVMDNDQDAGYILVNENETDIQVPEITTEGITMTEQFTEEVPVLDFVVYRYNVLESAAAIKDEFGNDRLIAAWGLGGNYGVITLDDAEKVSDVSLNRLADLHENYIDSVVAKGGVVPWASADTINDYYYNVHTRVASQQDIGGQVDRLKHRFSSVGEHTPDWWQPENGSGYPVGCGPTAWATLYSYWHQFKDRRGLFNFTDLEPFAHWDTFENTFVDDIMWELSSSKYLDTLHAGGNLLDKYGLTGPGEMLGGIKYARDKGYEGATVHKEDAGAFDQFDLVDASIRADRPAILFINNKEGEFWLHGNHYVVVEATQRFYKTGLDNIGYQVNWGSGASTRKWIYDLGEPDYTICDSYTVNIPYKPLEAMYMTALTIPL